MLIVAKRKRDAECPLTLHSQVKKTVPVTQALGNSHPQYGAQGRPYAPALAHARGVVEGTT